MVIPYVNKSLYTCPVQSSRSGLIMSIVIKIKINLIYLLNYDVEL